MPEKYIELTNVAARECNREDELPCLATEDCIHKLQWCDRSFDCKDGSDEYFCNVDTCPEALFRCENRKCIPGSARCNGFDNCGDGSDEICQRPTDYQEDSRLISDLHDISFKEITSPNVTDAVTRAAKYLLKKRELDNGWYNFTPRAVVALAFAEKSWIIPDKWIIQSLKKELNIKILLKFMQNNMKPSLCDLAHYINALYATCQEPRDFQGIDLVRLLRSEVDAAKKIDAPFVFLTLCIAKEINSGDTRKLLEMYDSMDDDRIGSKALIMMALTCISKNTQSSLSRSVQRKMSSFTRYAISLVNTADIYTRTLCIQALNALAYKTETDLATHQHPDGSFGDLLATYYAIPALLNKSLLDLKCESAKYEAMQMSIHLPNYDADQKKVTYSLWIDKGTYLNTHSMVITLQGNKTFFDVMKMAAGRSSIFSFLYESSSDGKKIYSLAGIPNDAETGKEWILYRGNEKSSFDSYSKEYLAKQKLGVDKIFPRTREHLIFWFERSLR